MATKNKKPFTRAQLRFKACGFLKMPPSLILDVIPNCAKTKYFIHYLEPRSNGKHTFHTELVEAKELEKQKL
jgi:hypothetical protein